MYNKEGCNKGGGGGLERINNHRLVLCIWSCHKTSCTHGTKEDLQQSARGYKMRTVPQ